MAQNKDRFTGLCRARADLGLHFCKSSDRQRQFLLLRINSNTVVWQSAKHC